MGLQAGGVVEGEGGGVDQTAKGGEGGEDEATKQCFITCAEDYNFGNTYHLGALTQLG